MFKKIFVLIILVHITIFQTPLYAQAQENIAISPAPVRALSGGARTQTLGFFNWKFNKCPRYREVANGLWQTEELDDLCSRVEKCTAKNKKIRFDNYFKLNFVHYSYSIKGGLNGSEYPVTHDFFFLVGPNELLLWRESQIEDSAGLVDINNYTIDRTMVLEFKYFTGGTAGYYENYYRYFGGGIEPIKVLFDEQSQKLIPPQFMVRRTKLDLNTMTAIIYLATDSDPNCCPSGKLELNIKLTAQGFEFNSGRFSSN